MGKTSLANYISDFARNNYFMVTAHIMNDRGHDIDELVVQIIERILNAILPEKWSEKIFDIISNNIESVGFGGFNIKFKPPKDELKKY